MRMEARVKAASFSTWCLSSMLYQSASWVLGAIWVLNYTSWETLNLGWISTDTPLTLLILSIDFCPWNPSIYENTPFKLLNLCFTYTSQTPICILGAFTYTRQTWGRHEADAESINLDSNYLWSFYMAFVDAKFLPSGTYAIINVEYNRSVSFNKCFSASEVDYGVSVPLIRWDLLWLYLRLQYTILFHANKKWSIQGPPDVFADIGPHAEEGEDVVSIKNPPKPHQWVIKRHSEEAQFYLS